jgi:hypothetical protein
MTKKNPFPGMNPFFELQWRGAHSRLIIYLNDALQERLPPDLVAAPEEQAALVSAGDAMVVYRPDVQVRQPGMLKEPGPADVESQRLPAFKATAPIRVFLDEEMERWVEIRDTAGRLITVIELLSPTNKLESVERDRYLRKRRDLISGGVNLVEVDLVRQGTSVFPAPVQRELKRANACYAVCVFRAARPGEREVYPIRLRGRLPAIAIPLRASDSDVVLDWQLLIDQCHERGRYHLLNYRLELDPPLEAEEAAWVEQRLHEHGLLQG